MSALALTQSQGVNLSLFPTVGRTLVLIFPQVLRWSALVFGVFYGINRQRNITASAEAAKVQHEWDRKEKLIEKAKLEWAKKTLPQQAKTGSGDIITDPDDKNFDLEAYLKKVEVESK